MLLFTVFLILSDFLSGFGDLKLQKSLCAYVFSNKNYFTCRVMMPFASADSYDPPQVFRSLQDCRIVRRKVAFFEDL